MSTYNEAERLFLEEVREKKKTASGVHHKTGKRGYVGKMLFPTDLMSRKEKYNHRKAGKVMTSNIYDTILPLDEFIQLQEFEQRNRLAYLRTKYSNKEIMKQMGMNNTSYYALVKELGLPTATRTFAERPNRKANRKATAKTAIAIESKEEAAPAPIIDSTATPSNAQAPIQEIIINGLHLVYNGTFKSEAIVKQLLKFGALLEDESDDFYIELKLMQKEKVDIEGN